MFGKLLKYDLKYQRRMWTIGACLTLICSALVGLCIRQILDFPRTTGEMYLYALMIFFAIALTILMAIFLSLSSLMPVMRYYSHFYTDEGYLTFTLPVSTAQLLWAKILNWVIVLAANTLLAGGGIAIATITASEPQMFFRIISAIGDFIAEALTLFVGSATGVGYIILISLFAIAYFAFSLILPFLSITIGAVAAKKNKLIAGIGVFIALQIVLDILLQVFGSLFSIFIIGSGSINLGLYLTLAAGILFYGGAAVGSYFLNHHLMSKKLNLT